MSADHDIPPTSSPDDGASPAEYSNWTLPTFPAGLGPDGDITPLNSPKIMAQLSRELSEPTEMIHPPLVNSRAPIPVRSRAFGLPSLVDAYQHTVNGENEEVDAFQLVTEDNKVEALRIKAEANRAFSGLSLSLEPSMERIG